MELARETYLTAWTAAVFAGADDLLGICRAIRSLPPPAGTPRPVDLLLDGLALLITEGRAAAAATLLRAGKVLADIPAEDVLRWGWMAMAASNAVWDDDSTRAIAARHVQVVRDVGALAQLPVPLVALGTATAGSGDFAGAAAPIAEADSVAAATGSGIAPYTTLRLLALRGREAEASALIASMIEQAAAGGQGLAAINAYWMAAVLYNGLGRYEEAAAAAQQATSNTLEPYMSMWALPVLVEAAARGGDAELAGDALERLAETTQPCGTHWALGVEARSRALLSDGVAADTSIAKRSIISAAPACAPSSPGRICSTASGCAARAAASTRANNCARPTRCSSRSAWRRSPNAPAGSCWPPGRRCASAAPRHARSSQGKRSRSPDSLVTACRTRRSAPGSSSAHARSNGTCARCPPSSASALAGSFRRRCPMPAGLSAAPSADPGIDQSVPRARLTA
jgi:hypothetical protein